MVAHNRVFYWIKGAPANRIGGPWWYRDFSDFDEHVDFIRVVKPFCIKMFNQDSSMELQKQSQFDIKPSIDAKEIICP